MTGVWMEVRCGSVCGEGGDNWTMPEECHQTANEGGFFSDMRTAHKHFRDHGWVIIDGWYWCPCCALLMRE